MVYVQIYYNNVGIKRREGNKTQNLSGGEVFELRFGSEDGFGEAFQLVVVGVVEDEFDNLQVHLFSRGRGIFLEIS